MRSLKLVAVVALLAGSVAFGQSQIVYTLEMGGNNHADQWEQNLSPAFTPGVTSNVPSVGNSATDSITWAVRVSVGGRHNGDSGTVPGGGEIPLGAANLVFDLELYKDGQLVSIGAAPLVAQGNQNVPSGAGFFSSINDGDTGGSRGVYGTDMLANAAFAMGISNTTDPMVAPDPARQYMLIDPKLDPDTSASAGPNFDYGWYPTANGRGGIDINGTKTADTTINKPELNGKLVGFGAGYKSYNYTDYAPGVGVGYVGQDLDYNTTFGFGRYVDRITGTYTYDPFQIPANKKERVLFEGQISTAGLAAGTYTLKVVPSVDGSNILHGAVAWDNLDPSYGGWGSFAAKADEVYPTVANNPGLTFQVAAPPITTNVVSRKLFYNQSAWDGNRLTIDAAPTAGDRNDDGDAIDPTKTPLMVGGGKSSFTNYTGYSKGINGLIYDIAAPTRAPVVGDFTFRYLGRTGTMAAVTKNPSYFAVWPGAGVNGSTRVLITFPNYVNGTEANSIGNGWVEVEIGTGFGLTAVEKHYWGNAPGETGNSTTDMLVNVTDVSAIKAHYTGASPPCPVDWQWNINKDALTNTTDVSYVKTKYTGGSSVVWPLTK